ncbi:MAG: hypothetical protein HKN76_14820 [Saprospiraceae bacterium]|nr:hypothetical protein [Saprospiraceae bacterium]
MMLRKLLIFLLVAFLTKLNSQEANIFTYPDVDAQLIKLWIQAEKSAGYQLTETYMGLETIWYMSKEQLLRKEFRHVNIDDFVAEQDQLIRTIEPLLSSNEYRQIAEKSYVILWNFQEIRKYFTSDLYPLDELLTAFSTYDKLHAAVDDPMLDLYEWNEFIQLFTDFKKQFKRYVVMSEPGFSSEKHVLFKLGVQRVFECSEEFEAALKTAQQNDFVAPCDDTRDALMELISLYQDPDSSL